MATARTRRIDAAVSAALDGLYPEGWRDILAGVEMLCTAEARAIFQAWRDQGARG